MKRDVENLISKPVSGLHGMGMFSRKFPVMTVFFLVLLIFTGAGGKMKDMSFDEFRDYLKHEAIDEFEAVSDGKESPAPVTGNKYVYIQIVTYCGGDDVMSSYRTWNSDDVFFMVYNNIRIKLNRNNVRTFIEETGSFSGKDIESGRMLPSIEYGLVKNKKYYAKVSSEEYHLPPDRESGEPKKRTNHVLWISNKPFKNGKPQVELTPLYKGWSY
jgi:hypothetical protein